MEGNMEGTGTPTQERGCERLQGMRRDARSCAKD